MTSSAENAIDLTRVPIGDDWERIRKAIDGMDYETIKGHFDVRGKNIEQLLEDMMKRSNHNKALGIQNRMPRWSLSSSSPEFRDSRKIDPWLRQWLNRMRLPFNDPKMVDRMGFDALRYNDMGERSWAFPDASTLTTPWGTPLGPPGGPPDKKWWWR